MPPLPRSRTSGSGSFAGAVASSGALPTPLSGAAIRPQFAGWRSLGCLSRRLALHLPDPFERGDPLAGDGLELRPQLGRVVGDQFGPVAGARYLDVEALLRGEVRVVRPDRGDHVVDRPPLERVHGRGPARASCVSSRAHELDAAAQASLPHRHRTLWRVWRHIACHRVHRDPRRHRENPHPSRRPQHRLHRLPPRTAAPCATSATPGLPITDAVLTAPAGAPQPRCASIPVPLGPHRLPDMLS